MYNGVNRLSANNYPRQWTMRILRGTTRIGIIVAFIIICTPIFLFLSLIPIRFGITGLSGWMSVYMARFFDWLFNVKVNCPEPEKFYQHRGLLAPNHCSYLDIVVLLDVLPVRFLSAVEVKGRPGIGWMAAAANTVFVDRTSTESRRSAVSSIAKTFHEDPDPPIVIFPEGRLGFGKELFPFKLGVFSLATNFNIGYLPVALRYHEPEITVWKGGLGESLTEAVWRLACYQGPVHVDVIGLTPVLPGPADDPLALAARAQYDVEEALGFPHIGNYYGDERESGDASDPDSQSQPAASES